MGIRGFLLDFYIGCGPVRWGLGIASALGTVLRSVGTNSRAGRWGLDITIVLGVVSCLGIYINKQGVSLWEPSGPPGTMSTPGSSTWTWRRSCRVPTRGRLLLLVSR